MASRDDWYRSDEWSISVEDEFEKRLLRSRESSRPQYLRIKGFALITSDDETKRRAGRQLLQRVVDGFPSEGGEVAGAYFHLAVDAEEHLNFGDALELYRRSAESDMSDSFGSRLKIVELIVREQMSDRYEEAGLLLNEICKKPSILNSQTWRMLAAGARLAARTGSHEQAERFARRALSLLESNQPVFTKHPGVGVILADEETVSEMQKLAEG